MGLIKPLEGSETYIVIRGDKPIDHNVSHRNRLTAIPPTRYRVNWW